MDTNVAYAASDKAPSDPVLGQVATDLNRYLASGRDRRKRLKFLSKKIEVHEKTLQRISARENRPSYITVFKIYRFLLNEPDDVKVLERCPLTVRSYLKNSNPQTLKSDISYSVDFEREMAGNPVMAEIVVLASTGTVKAAVIKKRFGDYGIRIAESLVLKNVLDKISATEYCSGRVSINMTPETIVRLGQQLIATYVKPSGGYDLGQNFMGFFAEGLNEDAYQRWLAIDAEAFAKKVALAKSKSNTGERRAFTFLVTDTLVPREPK